jgi:hypothetical protein
MITRVSASRYHCIYEHEERKTYYFLGSPLSLLLPPLPLFFLPLRQISSIRLQRTDFGLGSPQCRLSSMQRCSGVCKLPFGAGGGEGGCEEGAALGAFGGCEGGICRRRRRETCVFV